MDRSHGARARAGSQGDAVLRGTRQGAEHCGLQTAGCSGGVLRNNDAISDLRIATAERCSVAKLQEVQERPPARLFSCNGKSFKRNFNFRTGQRA